ncbi:MAG: ATP-binding protein, partial [SAR202 cluster bacterium]|nr:ATP-binding protein [SAR202 cluster bacterium]
EYGPCLILVDEWVAYARQLHDQSDLPGGSFETMFSFAQALTESAKLAGHCLLVVSLPASDTAGSPHTQADDVEVGGVRGHEALDRLRNVVGRLESSWRPATAEEGFEIVRRRLFEPLADPEASRRRDVIASAFGELYRKHRAEFPAACLTSDYERRLQAAFPIHPEVFDQLYGGWSTLVKFQRTRGVLRLMAAVIHSLWESGDRSPLILPATIPIDDARVQNELTRYLSDNWAPILESDVDGAGSTPCRIDAEVPALGKCSAARRVARTIYLASAPTAGAAHRGIEDRRVNLGCVMPGETPAQFGDALRRLAATATFLYQDGSRYWYATQPTVTRLAEDRAEQLRREPDRVAGEVERRVRENLREVGGFGRIHALPRISSDVPDDLDGRLVVLPAEQWYSRDAENPARTAARDLLLHRGSSPRLYRNTLVFLAAAQSLVQGLEQAVRKFLAWQSIVEDAETLNLDPHQRRQAQQQREAADAAATAQLPEAYRWLLVPEQETPSSEVTLQAVRLTGAEALAPRAARKLRHDDTLLSSLGPIALRKHLDDFRLWRDQEHVPVRQLAEDFATYLYLPRLDGPGVLLEAIRSGVTTLTWEQDTFAYAGGWDAAYGRYLGLQAGRVASISRDSESLVVKSEAARRQLDQERREDALA